MFFKLGVRKTFANFAEKYLYCCLFLMTWRSATLLKETPTQVFSCQICKVFKNTFFQRVPSVAASVIKPWNQEEMKETQFWNLLFWLGIFHFSLNVYYSTRRYFAPVCIFTASTRAFNLPTCVFNLIRHAFGLLICAFELVTHGFEYLTLGFELATSISKLSTRNS